MLYAEMRPDKEYRRSIHQLESLRLGRISTLERAMKVSNIHMPCSNVTEIRMLYAKSLEGFVLEGTETAKDVLRRYVSATMSVYL
jgi:hypothetical protein